MNTPTVTRAHRYSLRIASKSGSCNESVTHSDTHSDTQSVISAPSSVGVRTRRSCGATAVTKARRSARLAKMPRVCYAGMDEE